MAVLGEWVPPQLVSVLALQRVEEPETRVVLAGWTDAGRGAELPGDTFDFALSVTDWQWPGWICEPLWHDTLAVAMAKRSYLLANREVPCQEVLKQPVICSQSTIHESWRMTVKRVFDDVLHEREQTVETFDVAMTLVGAGYGSPLRLPRDWRAICTAASLCDRWPAHRRSSWLICSAATLRCRTPRQDSSAAHAWCPESAGVRCGERTGRVRLASSSGDARGRPERYVTTLHKEPPPWRQYRMKWWA